MDLSEADINTLEFLENQLLRPETRTSAEQVAKLLAEEYLEIGSSGKVYNKSQTIATLADSAQQASMNISKFDARRLAQNLALVTYHIHKTLPEGGSTHSLHSSVWRQTKNGWRILFHQGTPTNRNTNP